MEHCLKPLYEAEESVVNSTDSALNFMVKGNCVGQTSKLSFTARNLYQLNANEFPLTLHYGFEGHIIYPYRWRLQNDAKGMAIFC